MTPDYPSNPPFPEFCAKTGAVSHTFSEIARYWRFTAIRAFFGDVQNPFVRFWEAVLRAGQALARCNEKKARFGPPGSGRGSVGEIRSLAHDSPTEAAEMEGAG